MPLRAPSKGQLFVALFTILLLANTSFCHWVGRRFLDHAGEIRAAEAAGLDPAEAVKVPAPELGRGALLLFANAPLLVGLGFIVRAEDPSAGPLYWVLLLLGSTYLPAIVTLLVFLFAHPPKRFGQLPGVDWEDGTLTEDERDDDPDDRRRK